MGRLIKLKYPRLFLRFAWDRLSSYSFNAYSCWKIDFTKSWRHCDYFCMLIGPCSTLLSIQAVIIQIFLDCMDEFDMMDINDFYMFSEDKKSHYCHLQIVILRRQENELYVFPIKCKFFKDETDIFDALVGEHGITVRPNSSMILKSWPRISLITDLCSISWPLRFSIRFFSSFANVAGLLNYLKKRQVCNFELNIVRKRFGTWNMQQLKLQFIFLQTGKVWFKSVWMLLRSQFDEH